MCAAIIQKTVRNKSSMLTIFYSKTIAVNAKKNTFFILALDFDKII